MVYTLLSLSVAAFAGLLMTRVLKPLKLPSVTAYLIAGVLVGPYCLGRLGIEGLGFVTMESVNDLDVISDVALGFIAFAIGNEFRLTQLKKTGKQATVIGITQALMATLLVDIALLLVSTATNGKLTAAQAITLGAIATATAPAATLMVVRQYKAKGPLVDLLLPIVALDDAVGLVVFAVSFGIAQAMVTGSYNLISIIINPLLEIVLSLVLGALMGWLLTQLEKLFNSNSNRLTLSITFVLLTTALSMLEFDVGPVTISFSSLLVCMMLGTVFCNLCPLSHEIMARTDSWTNPLFAAFFVISGAQLELDVFLDGTIVLIGLVYIITRSAGKYIGAFVSARATHCSDTICKYLGITLLPQAGVALGMCVTAQQLGEQGELIRNITLFAILIYELIGPMLTKASLTKAGEIQPMSEEAKNRRQAKLENVKNTPYERHEKPRHL
ncbi:MAG: cation:proton antiporter [Lachnospiraceae bacterium]|nr:cation:proton antiporter [Lachnospiraceae bacterium]